jgi:spore coat polysaccharide biosynthesis predicted glycosyltransferase SpsG
MTIFIYADGTPERGYGHLFRQYGVWQSVASYYNMKFVCDTDMQRKFCKDRQVPFTTANTLPDAKDVLVLDSKSPLSDALQDFKYAAGYTIAVDTLATWSRDVDCAIFPSFYVDRDIASQFSEDTDIMTGRDYVILRQYEPSPSSRSILVTFGGSDPNQLTEMVVRNLVEQGLGSQTTALIGPGFTHCTQWFANEFPTIEVLGPQKTTFELVGSADYIISALGVTLQEAEYHGKPSLVIFNYREDAADFDILCDASVHPETWINGGFYGDLEAKTLTAVISDLAKLSPAPANQEEWGAGWYALFNRIMRDLSGK